MPTSSSSSMVRLRAAPRSMPLCSSSASLICRPIVKTGFSEVIGSWKIIAMSFPRTLRMSSSLSLSRSRPSKMTWPETMRPGGCGISRISDRALTLLPHPDSPTRPSASPSASVNATPLTALTTPSWVKNCVRRSETSNSKRRCEVSSVTVPGRPPSGCGCARVYRAERELAWLPAQDRLARRRYFVEPAHHLRVRRVEHGLGRLLAFLGDLTHYGAEIIERRLRFALRRLDHDGFLDDQREVDGRWMNREIDQSLGNIQRAHPGRLFLAPTRKHELVHARAVVGLVIEVFEQRAQIVRVEHGGFADRA